MVNETQAPDQRDLLILQTLRSAHQPISGQLLAEQLGISRVALWKRIEALKACAYDIQAGKRGYWLRHDDAVVPWEFPQQTPIFYHMETGSTMDHAWDLAEAGAASGTMVLADRQSSGRGRLSSQWYSPPGGLFLTIIIKAKIPASYATSLLMQGAYTIAAWLKREYNCPLGIQWPQSLVLADRKVGGLLVEMAGTPECPHFFTLGLGLDLGVLGLSDHSPHRRAIANAFHDNLISWADNPIPQVESWRQFCAWSGKAIILRDWQGQEWSGIAMGYDTRAALQLQTHDTQSILTFPAGETETVHLDRSFSGVNA